jgi:hypothetical protein
MEQLVQIGIGGHKKGLAQTLRLDAWWIGPALTVAIIGAFLVYSTWALLQGEHYFVGSGGFGGYLSPLYAPVLFTDASRIGSVPIEHAWIGAFPSWWPQLGIGEMIIFIPMSPAALILPFPGTFRLTCYYYRKAYYRSFAATPPGCAVGALPQQKYRGETFILLFQNLHRYTLWFALLLVPILTWESFQSFFRDGEFGVGVGSLVLVLNTVLLSSYTFGCHSFRHLIGGRLNTFSKWPEAFWLWKRVTWFNERHMLFAWASLFWVGFSDLYVRLVSMGVITDLNTWGS